MPKKVKLVSYFVQVREYDSQDYFDLASWPDDTGFCSVIENCFARIAREPLQDQQTSKVFTSRKCWTENNAVFGTLGSGDYGFQAVGRDIRNGQRAYQRREHHTEEVNFYYQYRDLPGVNKGILMLQRFGRRGIKQPFTNLLRKFIRDQHGNYVCSVHPLAPSGYIQRLIRGGIKEIRFIERKRPDDDTDVVVQRGWIENPRKKTTTYVAERARNLGGQIVDFLGYNTDIAQLTEITGIEFDQLKVEVRVGRGTRVIDLTEGEVPTAKFDITERVTTEGSHPTFDSIHSEANDLIEEILEDQGVPS